MQKIDCRKFAQKQGWRVVKEVAEKGVSGSKVSASKRDAIQQLKEEAANGEFDILLVYMFDRLGRIESETPFVLEWFVQHGIEMWSTHEGQQKIETHGDKLMNYIRFWQAAGESEKTSIRTRDRIRQIVSSGHYTGGFVCYGYQLVDQGRRNKRDKPVMDLVINEEEATWVRELFYKVIQEGTSGYALAEMLNNRGLRTRAGAKFQSSNIFPGGSLPVGSAADAALGTVLSVGILAWIAVILVAVMAFHQNKTAGAARLAVAYGVSRVRYMVGSFAAETIMLQGWYMVLYFLLSVVTGSLSQPGRTAFFWMQSAWILQASYAAVWLVCRLCGSELAGATFCFVVTLAGVIVSVSAPDPAAVSPLSALLFYATPMPYWLALGGGHSIPWQAVGYGAGVTALCLAAALAITTVRDVE